MHTLNKVGIRVVGVLKQAITEGDTTLILGYLRTHKSRIALPRGAICCIPWIIRTSPQHMLYVVGLRDLVPYATFYGRVLKIASWFLALAIALYAIYNNFNILVSILSVSSNNF